MCIHVLSFLGEWPEQIHAIDKDALRQAFVEKTLML